MNELDHLGVELSGSNLIEASAGTGKTYAIACLYLRLLIEKSLSPDQILVVTFTEAATEELRGRIRARIREALDVFGGAPAKDPFLDALCRNGNGKGPGSALSMDLLDRALKCFDTASIFTIHGFCLRALQDNAFESGSLYDTGLVADPSDLIQEAVDDFWRISFFGEQAPLLVSALAKGYSPGYFMEFARKMLDNPKMKIIPDPGTWDRGRLHGDALESFGEVRESWKKCRDEVVEIFENDKGLSRGVEAYKREKLPELIGGMDSFVHGDNPYDIFPGFEKFRSSGIAKGTKPKGDAPEHPFFRICEKHAIIVERSLLALKGELVGFCRKRILQLKREQNIRFFSDLLNDLHAALYGETGEELARCLRGKYRAALIDEFQDTDPVQYDIFRKICADPDIPLFLIGDPKQAIYSFRGADVFAYMEAANEVERGRRFTLTDNWRSDPRLLEAFNAVFDKARNPFVFEDIAYHPIRSGNPECGKALRLGSSNDAPLQIWIMPPGGDGGALGVGSAGKAVQGSVAAEIARLLGDAAEGRACIDGRPVIPGDIAVIVRSHRQAGQIQESLRELRIPSVMRSDESIFATSEAREVFTLLGALAEPGRESRVRAALATSIMGRSGNDIASLLDDEAAWEECLERFRGYHQTWLERGFMVMSQALLAREGVRGRLLGRPDGERRLTNVLHCFEILHQAAHERSLGVEGLLSWFGEKVSSGEKSEEYQIRLETDEKAVKIVTVHVSKGLEYPIVFCPYMWGGTRTDADVVTFHDRFRMVRDYGSDDMGAHRVLAEKENLAEGLRLLYVALTRAKYRCYLVAGKVSDRTGRNRPETSPVSYLFHAPVETRTGDDLVSRVAQEVRVLSPQEMETQLRKISDKAKGAISVVAMPAADAFPSCSPSRDGGKPLACRSFTSRIDREWRVASFTSFAEHDPGAVELPDRDGTDGEEVLPGSDAAGEEPRRMSIFSFPRGVQAGIFLHWIFEQVDFADPCRDKIGELVERGLERYGFPEGWHPHVCSMVANVLAVPLSSQTGDFSLGALRTGSWVTELEFFFPLRFVTSDLLKDCLRKWNGGGRGPDLHRVSSLLRFRPVRGMIRGFMDMVFEHGGKYYLVDWKSNHLGNGPEDYARDNLARAMERNLYPLQYLLYTVALNRYLSLRVRDYAYETHFGGVLYMFVRGVCPERREELGIFRDIPPSAMIEELTSRLVDMEREAEER